MRVLPFPRTACLSQGTRAVVCGERGVPPPPGTSLPAESPACGKYCLQRVAWGWQSAPCSWGSEVKPQSLHPYEEVHCCVRGCRAPHPQWIPTMLRLNFLKLDPSMGMVGVETVVAGSCPEWPH